MSVESLAAKSARLAPYCVYGVVLGRRDLLRIRCLHGESSGEWHLLTLLPDGTLTCDCPGFTAHGACYHIGTLATDEAYSSERDAILDLTRSAVISPAAAAPRAPRLGDKTFTRDWL